MLPDWHNTDVGGQVVNIFGLSNINAINLLTPTIYFNFNWVSSGARVQFNYRDTLDLSSCCCDTRGSNISLQAVAPLKSGTKAAQLHISIGLA
jgi:hypothetical protein